MTDWIVLAGGKGTRSANPSLPKLLQTVGESSVIQFLVDALNAADAKRVVFALQHKSELVVSWLESHASILNFSWLVTIDKGVGPVDALRQAANQLSSENFGIILGDTLISAPLGKFFEEFEASGKAAAIVVRQSDHLEDSDVFAIDAVNNQVKFLPKFTERTGFPGLFWGATGILFAKRRVILELESKLSDVASALVSQVGESHVELLRSSWYHRDTGTEGRLNRVNRDYSSGLIRPENLLGLRRGAVFMDRDGTLIPDQPHGRTDFSVNDLNPKCIRLLQSCRAAGAPVFLVTNQPQCAKGFISMTDVMRVHNLLQLELGKIGAWFDDIVFCPHHPDSGFTGEVTILKITCTCRKPEPGMVFSLAERHSIDLSKSLVVGDSDADYGLATRIESGFLDVNSWSDEAANVFLSDWSKT